MTADPPAAQVLRWIAEAPPWFPAEAAATRGVPRESLDEPLAELRREGWAEVAEWRKGIGQGYRITDEGSRILAGSVEAPATQEAEAVIEDPPAIAAPALLFSNVAWFAIGLLTAWKLGVGVEFLKGDGHPGAVQVLYKTGVATGLSILQCSWWRLLTCGFVHVGLFHLICNILLLGMLGPAAEGLWGKARFATVYLLSGIVGAATALAMDPDRTIAGASAAIWGVLAGMLAWLFRHRRELPPGRAAECGRILGVVTVVNILASFGPNASAAGHFSGGIAGLVAVLAFERPAWGRRLGVAAAILLPLSAAGLLSLSMERSSKWVAVKQRDVRQRAERDRSRVQAAAGERFGKVNAAAVYALMNGARWPLALDLPKANARARQKAQAMRANAEEADAKSRTVGGETAERLRAYFAAVADFAETVDRQLGSPVPDGAPVLVKMEAAVAAWNAAVQ